MIFNEFVLTSRPYIRTVTDVRPEWYVFSSIAPELPCLTAVLRLLELAHNYFDIASFPDGETKRALQRVVNKKLGKSARDNDPGAERRDKKKRKVQ